DGAKEVRAIAADLSVTVGPRLRSDLKVEPMAVLFKGIEFKAGKIHLLRTVWQMGGVPPFAGRSARRGTLASTTTGVVVVVGISFDDVRAPRRSPKENRRGG